MGQQPSRPAPLSAADQKTLRRKTAMATINEAEALRKEIEIEDFQTQILIIQDRVALNKNQAAHCNDMAALSKKKTLWQKNAMRAGAAALEREAYALEHDGQVEAMEQQIVWLKHEVAELRSQHAWYSG